MFNLKTVISTTLMVPIIAASASAVPHPQVEPRSTDPCKAPGPAGTLRLFSDLHCNAGHTGVGNENTFTFDEKNPNHCFHLYNGLKSFDSAQFIGEGYQFHSFSSPNCSGDDIGIAGGISYPNIRTEVYESLFDDWLTYNPAGFRIGKGVL
ncbi:hypothetical protein BJ138DRAFT_1183121 [Hygrophoropsis aurantiaca]|uniref:Uncharacterized protein n=1 Tax=Hygrophoropsis aurantiaca TaxID=72124 RepID=A0ACB8A061_9AGAM|nr:hypothetical protein BJ138DRAFT_1183121 [Hygrophoropsis aurantiaca]